MRGKNERSVSDFNNDLKLNGFNIFRIEEDVNNVRTYSRKDFYKICITTGKSIIHYADRSYRAEGTVLFFGNPHIPYSWETVSTTYVGYTCLFSEEFLNVSERNDILQQSPFFKIGGTPIFEITDAQRIFLSTVFQKMIGEQQSEYLYKDDLVRSYINLVMHEAMKLHPSQHFDQHKSASSRIAAVFMELLERQFPVESPDRPLSLKTAHDYAMSLSVHVNYLNRMVKEATGKSTTTHITERIVNEAKALLQHTDWNIAEIAYALGFEYPSYFNNFFKRITGTNPMAIRVQEV
jgi:AraC family transcriptional activator of pobA